MFNLSLAKVGPAYLLNSIVRLRKFFMNRDDLPNNEKPERSFSRSGEDHTRELLTCTLRRQKANNFGAVLQ